MSRMNNTPSSRSTTGGHAYYKITRTTTDSDGKKHTETVEMVDDNAIKVRLFHGNTRCYP